MRNLFISENKRVLVNELGDGKLQIVHKGQGSITLDEKDFFEAANTIFEVRMDDAAEDLEPEPPRPPAPPVKELRIKTSSGPDIVANPTLGPEDFGGQDYVDKE